MTTSLNSEVSSTNRPATASPAVRGVNLDVQTRCKHYHGSTDIIAIKMKCCGAYYACKDCHEELADHAIEVWQQSEWQGKAILCGVCRSEFSIEDYMNSEYRCSACHASFNPKCRNHYQYYFEQKA